MNLRLRTCTLCLIIAINSFCSAAFAEWKHDESQQKAETMLRDAMEATRKANITFSIINPIPEWKSAKEAICLHKYDERTGMPSVVMEFKDMSGKRLLKLISNENGQYAYLDRRDVWVKGGFFLNLSILENLSMPFFRHEMKYNSYKISDCKYEGIDCLKVTSFLDVPDNNLPRLSGQSGHPVTARDSQAFLNNHPFSRVYIIDKKDNIILAKRLYGKNGNLISEIELKKVSRIPNWRSLEKQFTNPNDVKYIVEDEFDLLSFENALKYTDNQIRLDKPVVRVGYHIDGSTYFAYDDYGLELFDKEDKGLGTLFRGNTLNGHPIRLSGHSRRNETGDKCFDWRFLIDYECVEVNDWQDNGKDDQLIAIGRNWTVRLIRVARKREEPVPYIKK